MLLLNMRVLLHQLRHHVPVAGASGCTQGEPCGKNPGALEPMIGVEGRKNSVTWPNKYEGPDA